MHKITRARDQVEMLRPWTREAAPRTRFPKIKSNGLDALGFTQRKLNGNFMSWMDQLSDQDKEEGGLWYPTGNDWGHHMADLHDEHPDKAFGVMSKMSPQRDWYGNLGDAHNILSNYRHNPSGILTPAGISGTDNLRQSLRVMDADDDPDAIHAAFLGTKNVTRGGQKVAVPRTPKDLPKTHDFYTALRDPEAGGAGNYAHQPAVADSWMSRSMLWSKNRWDDAHNGGRPLTWPGKGSGQGLDKPLPVKKLNPHTGTYEVVGVRKANARDVAARVVGLSGGYDRMRQAMQNGAARHGMPFAHGAQAAVWKSISGNANPDPTPRYGDPSEIQHDPAGLWNEQWARRASGLHVPVGAGRLMAGRIAAVGSTEPEDTLDEGWGTPQDIAHILQHIRLGNQGWDYWEDAPRRPDPEPRWTSAALQERPRRPGEVPQSSSDLWDRPVGLSEEFDPFDLDGLSRDEEGH